MPWTPAIAETRLARLETWFDIRRFEAAIDGTTDDADAWDAAIAAADAAGGGVVFHPGGISAISRGVGVGFTAQFGTASSPAATNSQVSFAGVGRQSALKAIGAGWTDEWEPMLQVRSLAGSAGSRNVVIRDLLIDGNNLAPVGLDFFAVQSHLSNVEITSCTRIGLLVDGAQNCTFTGINCARNGTSNDPWAALSTDHNPPDSNLCIMHGAANNSFYGIQCSASDPLPTDEFAYNLAIVLGPDSPFSWIYPFANHFYGFQIERRATNSKGAVVHRAGRDNKFIGGMLQHSGAVPLVTIEKEDATIFSGALELNSVFFSGDGTSGNVGVKCDVPDANAARIVKPYMENIETAFACRDATNVDFTPPIRGGVTNLTSNLSGGSANTAALAATPVLRVTAAPNAIGNLTDNPFTAGLCFDQTAKNLWVDDAQERRKVFLTNADGYVESNVASGSVTAINARSTDFYIYRITDNTAFTVPAPTNPSIGRRLVIDLNNTSGGAHGTISWNAVFKLADPTLDPIPNGGHTYFTFLYSDSTWREIVDRGVHDD